MNPEILARNILLLDSLKEIGLLIKRENIEIIILKGAALIELGIFQISEREMSDIDILIHSEDKEKFAGIIKNLGFLPMPESSTAYFKNTNPQIPPIIIDIHTSFVYQTNLDEIWQNKIRINENIFSLSYPDMITFAIMHSVLHHGYFDEKAVCDVLKILNHCKNLEKLKSEIIIRSNKLKISKIMSKAFLKIGVPLSDLEHNLKEFFLLPFINLAFKKHYTFNEYLLPFFYNLSYGFEMLFPSKEFMIRRYGSNSFKNRLRRIIKLISKIRE